MTSPPWTLPLKFTSVGSARNDIVLFCPIIVIMRNLLVVALIGLTSVGKAQSVFSTKYESQAEVKVFVVDFESQADLLVCKVKYPSQAKGNEGLWFFEEYSSKADKKIFFVSYASQAEVKIFFIEYESKAGWKNKELIHHFY